MDLNSLSCHFRSESGPRRIVQSITPPDIEDLPAHTDPVNEANPGPMVSVCSVIGMVL